MQISPPWGTEQTPLRPSGVAKLLACEAYYEAKMLYDTSSRAADTGTLVHRAVEVLHTFAGDRESEAALEACKEAITLAAPTYPLGDPDAAWRCFLTYFKDQARAAVTHTEVKVRCVRQNVWFAGTVDQIRRGADRAYRIWDLKTGSTLNPSDTLTEAYIQQAVYLIAARDTFPDLDIQPGGILHYPIAGAKPRERKEILYPGLTIAGAEGIVKVAAERVLAWRRRGRAVYTPSVSACTSWCPRFRRGDCPAHTGESK